MEKLLITLAIIVITIAFILLIIALSEPHMPVFNRYDMDESGKSSGSNLNILFFSDLHAEFCFVNPKKITDYIDKTKPDAVIFGGDICNKPKGIGKGISYLNVISDYCGKMNIPFLGVTGNHDVCLSEDDIAKCGFDNINGTYRIIRGIAISGVTDSGRANRVWPETATVPETSANKHVLIVHNPDYLLNMKHSQTGLPVEYALSGHIHGGQIRTPFKIEFTVLRKDILPKKGIHQGVHTVNGIRLFISRGLGCILMPLRLYAKPEISLISIPTENS